MCPESPLGEILLLHTSLTWCPALLSARVSLPTTSPTSALGFIHTPWPCWSGLMAIPILQVRKLRLGGGKQHAQVHTAHRGQTQDWNPGFPFPVQSCLSQKTRRKAETPCPPGCVCLQVVKEPTVVSGLEFTHWPGGHRQSSPS